jgi:hypothetical protein
MACDTQSDTVTDGIRVTVRSALMPEMSSAAEDRYMYSYKVQIKNESVNEPVQLVGSSSIPLRRFPLPRCPPRFKPSFFQSRGRPATRQVWSAGPGGSRPRSSRAPTLTLTLPLIILRLPRHSSLSFLHKYSSFLE